MAGQHLVFIEIDFIFGIIRAQIALIRTLTGIIIGTRMENSTDRTLY